MKNKNIFKNNNKLKINNTISKKILKIIVNQY